jgi:hypothetical protein
LVFEPLFGVRFDHSRYHEIRDWFEKKFGFDAAMTKLLTDDSPWLNNAMQPTPQSGAANGER